MVEIVPYSHAFLDICRANPLAEFDYEFGYLLDVDDIFALICIFLVLYYFGASGYLEGMVFRHPLPVGCDIP